MSNAVVVTVDSLELKRDKDYTYDEATSLVTFCRQPPRTSKVKIIVIES